MKRNDIKASRERYPLILLVVLILVWSFELLFIQQTTTLPSWSMHGPDIAKDAARRMVFNLAGCTLLLCVLRREWLYSAFIHRAFVYSIFIFGAVWSAVLVSYANYFGSPLSWFVISHQWREGLCVANYGVTLLRWPTVALLLVALIIKVGLWEVVQRHSVSFARRRKWAAVAACVYVAMAVGLTIHKPIHGIRTGSPEYIYGYTVAWCAELLFYDREFILKEALAKAEIRSDKLSVHEPLLDIGQHLAVVQVESLDFNVLDAELDGKPVMPFLSQMKQQAVVFKVKPFHSTGSAEADFSLLTSSTPNGRIMPFKVHGFPYNSALPWLAKERGYTTVALHGNTGSFFHRRSAYEKMGFSKLYFSEEMEPLGVRVGEDDDVLRFSAKLLNEAQRPTFHFVITITSHGPFDNLPKDKIELFAKPANLAQAYLNSMRYVDRALKQYYHALPDDTTLVIYGDHESGVRGYAGDRSSENKIPWFFCRKNENLAKRHPARDTGRTSLSDLGQLDLVCYLRKSLAATNRVASQLERPNSSKR